MLRDDKSLEEWRENLVKTYVVGEVLMDLPKVLICSS